MEHILENKFLNKEMAQKEAFNEDEEELHMVDAYGGEQGEF